VWFPTIGLFTTPAHAGSSADHRPYGLKEQSNKLHSAPHSSVLRALYKQEIIIRKKQEFDFV
jgi:hypothetical protein